MNWAELRSSPLLARPTPIKIWVKKSCNSFYQWQPSNCLQRQLQARHHQIRRIRELAHLDRSLSGRSPSADPGLVTTKKSWSDHSSTRCVSAVDPTRTRPMTSSCVSKEARSSVLYSKNALRTPLLPDFNASPRDQMSAEYYAPS
jgi:hypothetical protein